ncbi:GATA transcription factor 11-like [Cynara cardunculus var. scolymus]|uniref:GATA-type domain-containing protein n=1 Tax=Cynara cardunculus var. scolymus TaxID=59895 RepID=A0A103Y0C4_CYNCS|nr:GATA transcription factor 11-like [Cynara cardunculus var. scolymus]KVI00188.1 hypothetical protein Ccrd_021561 [Cynara cardunculus var. scolymus]
MESQDNGMCGVIDYNHEVYDEDCFGDILNILDLPVENLEGDGLAEDWALKLGPIPSEVFREMLPPVSQIGGVVNDNGGGGGSADLLTECFVLNDETCQPKCQPILKSKTSKFQPKPQPPSFPEGKKQYPMPRSFEAPSPDSVLERRTSGSTSKTVSFGTEIAIPVRSRTKRSQSGSTTNPWSRSPLLIPLQKERKKRRNLFQQPVNETKKCSHCEITKTPQWREGPMGPKTLCNACGVRYRSGRLFPEYRPAASPTFIPSVHSNSHRKVIEMRQKMDDDYVTKKVLSSNSRDTGLCSCE